MLNYVLFSRVGYVMQLRYFTRRKSYIPYTLLFIWILLIFPLWQIFWYTTSNNFQTFIYISQLIVSFWCFIATFFVWHIAYNYTKDQLDLSNLAYAIESCMFDISMLKHELTYNVNTKQKKYINEQITEISIEISKKRQEYFELATLISKHL